ncbi:MAG: hypothetical protein JXA96_00845 [Sedimentisphaerales bacterium]|nr:hypothetical protein [Sedimentisphaerales bacterium]
MNNNEILNLAMDLLKADSEKKVISILQKVNYWNDPSVWRYYGDNENNYSTIGNQQSRPDSALVEKVVNSADARLMNECMIRMIDPESKEAPKTIREAISFFFENNPNPKSETAGIISEWPTSKRTEVARGITVAATGYKPKQGRLCISIADMGEGQTPESIPQTFLSLHRSNKLRIPFVQGKFNMGGTGALKFCGQHNLELILTRRNPALINSNVNESDNMWGFTIVRREDPEGGRRSSVYTYLAPIKNEQHSGVLRFYSENMPIFPKGQNPYAENSQWGTLIKLYEYTATGYSNTHMFRKDGLQSRLDILLPDVALPIRLHECRDFKGHKGSFETTLTGLGVRLSDDKMENLEKGFPYSCPIIVSGEELEATIYAFKKGKADTYRKNEGVIFTVNGQTHGHLTRDFFRRKKIGLSYIADSVLVIISCDRITGRAREDLFMNSRDRLCGGELRSDIEQNLIELLSKHEGLRELKNRRREEEIQSKLDDSKPLEDILESLLKNSPTLASLFLHGNRIANPFKTKKVKSSTEEYIGKKFPTFFKFKGKEYGTILDKNCHINYRCRISFETDAENDYLSRKTEKGSFILHIKYNKNLIPAKNFVGPNLQNGIASLSIQLPEECKIGDTIEFTAITTDISRVDPFINQFNIKVIEPMISNSRKSERTKPPKDEDGDERELPSQIALPNITQVREEKWDMYDPPFNKYTALRVIHAGESETGEKKDIYDFFVNMGNIFLKADLKSTSVDIPLVEARFIYGMALIGLAILHDSEKTHDNVDNIYSEDQNEKNIEQTVESITKSIAPILLPMIDGLGALETIDMESYSSAGEVD